MMDETRETVDVEMHVVVAVPLTVDAETGAIVEVGQPYTCDENPFTAWEGETYVVGGDDIDDWRRSTSYGRDAGALDALADLFRRPNWQIRGSGADFIAACAEHVGMVRDIETRPAADECLTCGESPDECTCR